MAIGTAAAIGLGAAGIGSAISGSSASKAAGKAAANELAVARENNALQRDIYDQNKAALSPFMDRGNTAGSYLNAFLGLPTQATTSGAPNYASYVQSSPDLLAEFNRVSSEFGGDMGQYGQFHYNTFGQGEGRTLPGQTSTPAVTQGQAQNAFGDYIKNSDYGFQFGTGSNALNSGYAGAGSLQSGAAMKGLEKFRQNLQAGYRNEYTGQLAGQQGVGLGAASALAGVGQNYAGAVSANNSNAAGAASNAALIKGQNNPFGNALGILGGGLLGLGLK